MRCTQMGFADCRPRAIPGAEKALSAMRLTERRSRAPCKKCTPCPVSAPISVGRAQFFTKSPARSGGTGFALTNQRVSASRRNAAAAAMQYEWPELRRIFQVERSSNLCNAGVSFQMKNVGIFQSLRLKMAARKAGVIAFPGRFMHSLATSTADAAGAQKRQRALDAHQRRQ